MKKSFKRSACYLSRLGVCLFVFSLLLLFHLPVASASSNQPRNQTSTLGHRVLSSVGGSVAAKTCAKPGATLGAAICIKFGPVAVVCGGAGAVVGAAICSPAGRAIGGRAGRAVDRGVDWIRNRRR